MKVLAFAVVILFALCVFGQDREGDPCPVATSNCVECAQAGCKYCKGAASKSACYASSESPTGICDKSANESPDEWILPGDPTKCFGGCSAAEDCSNCASFEGCGYCHMAESGQTGCLKGTKAAPPGDCQVWTVGSCALPCDGRLNCQHCMDGSFYEQTACQWYSQDPNDGRVGKCVFANNGTAEGTMITNLDSCPLIPAGDAVSSITLMVPLTIIAALASVL